MTKTTVAYNNENGVEEIIGPVTYSYRVEDGRPTYRLGAVEFTKHPPKPLDEEQKKLRGYSFLAYNPETYTMTNLENGQSQPCPDSMFFAARGAFEAVRKFLLF